MAEAVSKKQTQKTYDLADFARTAPPSAQKPPHWYQPQIDRKQLSQLMKRRNGPALRDTVLLYLGLILSGGGAVFVMQSSVMASLPIWAFYGVLYASAADSRWHECGHGTAFKTAWMNRVVYHIACFMILRNPVSWKWSHARHHTDTLIVGRDPEIALMRPPLALKTFLNFFGIPDIIDAFRRMFIHSAGSVAPDEAVYIPEDQISRAILISRIWLMIFACVIAFSVWTGSFIPLLLIGGPRLYGSWHFNMTGLIQHGGLADNVDDHRLNTRTVMMNPISRFIYLNMNYHIEHHIFPAVPYYNLPALHELIKDELPQPSPSLWSSYAEMMPILWRQFKGEDVFIDRTLTSAQTR